MSFCSAATMIVATSMTGVYWASPDIAGGPSERDPQDGVVDALDLVALLSRWGSCADNCCLGDINRDGVVDIDDLTIILSEIGTYDPRTFVRCREGHEPGSPPSG